MNRLSIPVAVMVLALAIRPAGARRMAPVLDPLPNFPISCDFITRLDLDYQEDTTGVPYAFDVNVGEVPPQQLALFRIYALSDDIRFIQEVTSQTRMISAQVRSIPGSEEVRGRFIAGQFNGAPVVAFVPNGQTAEDRLALLEFSVKCVKPTEIFRTRFLLTVKGSKETASDAVPVLPVERTSPAFPPRVPAVRAEPAECADLGVRVLGPPEAVQNGDPVQLVYEIANHGPARFENPVVEFPRPFGVVTDALMPERGTIYATGRHGFLTGYGFRPGPLEAGETVQLVLRGRAAYRGTFTLSAALPDYLADCNPANNSGSTQLTVQVPLRSDLSGEWEQTALEREDRPVRPFFRLRGRLRVENRGETDAPRTRVALFFSEDPSLDPKDRFLGFRDIGTLAQGAAERIEVEARLNARPPVGPRYILALLDSSNTAFETNEGNNIASGKCR